MNQISFIRLVYIRRVLINLFRVSAQIITSNTLPTTPEVNEENSHKNLPPEDKQSKGNCLNCLRCYCCFKQHREPHQCSQSATSTVFDENTRREYFYKKNPVYNEPVEVAEQYGKFLFRHSALHAFKYDQVYDFTRIQRVQRYAGGFGEQAFSVERSKQVPKCGSRIFTKYRTSRVSLRRTKIEASMRKKNIPKENRTHSLTNDNKRRNLYQYPKFYYEFILKDLEREALWCWAERNWLWMVWKGLTMGIFNGEGAVCDTYLFSKKKIQNKCVIYVETFHTNFYNDFKSFSEKLHIWKIEVAQSE